MSIAEAVRTSTRCSANCHSGCITMPIVVRDQEVNRQFFEDLLGIPLVATWCEKPPQRVARAVTSRCATRSSAMADGGALAFFAFGDPEIYKLVIAEKPPVVGNFDHVAFKVSDDSYDEIVARLKAQARNSARRITGIASRSMRRHRMA